MDWPFIIQLNEHEVQSPNEAIDFLKKWNFQSIRHFNHTVTGHILDTEDFWGKQTWAIVTYTYTDKNTLISAQVKIKNAKPNPALNAK